VDEVVTCPNCARKLKVRAENLGSTLACPACKHHFAAGMPAAEPEPPDADEAPRRRPAGARDYADEYGIDLDETHERQVSDSGRADRELKRWKEDLPEAKQAYEASGKMPAGAMVFLGGGALAGAVAGPGAFLGVAGLTTLAVWLVYLLIAAMGEFCGKIPCIVVILAFIVGLVGYGAAFALMGYVAAVCTTWVGKLAKNRSPGAGSLFSFFSAVAGLAVLAVGAYYFNETQFRQPVPAWGQMDWSQKGIVAAVVLGALVAIIAAAAVGWDSVQSAKFCEGCERFMETTELKGMRLGRLKGFARAVRDKELRHAADLIDGPLGQDGVAQLFHCPGCGCGYLDVHAQFNATWKGSEGDESKAEKWLVASVALTEKETPHFRPDQR
jgi:hypothetical protein